jgi:hypothetical protein
MRAEWHALSALGQQVTVSAISPGGAYSSPATTSTLFPTANKAFYFPVRLAKPFRPALIFWGNGATASGNVDAGIYDLAGTRLFSTGSTAQSGTTTLQSVSVSGLLLAAGRYYVALAADNTTATFLRGAQSVTLQRGYGALQQASAFPLPATATFAALASTRLGIPLLGLSRKAVL